MPPTPHPAAHRFAEITQRLTAIFMALQPLIAHHFLRHPWVPNAITVPLWNRFGRHAARFARLAARLAAGRLPPHRTAREAPPVEPPAARPARRPPPPYPTRPGWMLAAMGWQVAVYRNRLERLLAEPAMAELVALAPGPAGRILRPLCHMLGLPSPCPPPPRRPRAPKHAAPPRSPPLRLSPRRPRIATPLHPLVTSNRKPPAPTALAPPFFWKPA